MSRTTFERLALATAIAFMFVLAIGLSNEALGTWGEADYINEQASEALDGVDPALVNLAETSVDEYVSVVCREYADVALTAIVLAQQSDRYPDGTILREMSVYLNEQLPISMNDCQLGI